MLHEDRGLGRICISLARKSWNAEDSELITILGCHQVRLKLETILSADLLEVPLGVTLVTFDRVAVAGIVRRGSEEVIQLLGLSFFTDKLIPMVIIFSMGDLAERNDCDGSKSGSEHLVYCDFKNILYTFKYLRIKTFNSI